MQSLRNIRSLEWEHTAQLAGIFDLYLVKEVIRPDPICYDIVLVHRRPHFFFSSFEHQGQYLNGSRDAIGLLNSELRIYQPSFVIE
jgi:hypothetical protein